MTKYILWVFLLALWHGILFYGKDLGLQVLLFLIPLTYFLYYVMNKNNKINNKKGLLYFLGAILLSISYLLYDNYLFNVLNVIAISLLLTFGVIYTINPTYNIVNLVTRVFQLLIMPYDYIARLFRVTKIKIKEKIRLSDKVDTVIKTILIVLPISILIIVLLSSADMIFAEIFDSFLDKILKIFSIEFLDKLIGRIILFIIMFFVIGCTTMYIIYEIKEDNKKENIKEINRDLLTIKTLVTVLNLIYILFDFIQVKSLLLHSVASNINYAEYARQGFFQLLVVSVINICIILSTRRYENKENTKSYNYVKIMNVIMVFLTIIIIGSSFMRMYMYEMQYGYTVLRLLVFIVLIVESLLMIPTVMYIFNKDVNILKFYLIIIVTSYIIVNFINMDYVIARKNVDRYYSSHHIDVDYLENYNMDNIPVLIELYINTNDMKIKNELNDYFYSLKFEIAEENIFEFNVSKHKAYKELKKVLLIKDYRDYLKFE